MSWIGLKKVINPAAGPVLCIGAFLFTPGSLLKRTFLTKQSETDSMRELCSDPSTVHLNRHSARSH